MSTIQHIRLSELTKQLYDSIQNQFGAESYWISARAMNVKKYISNRRCYLSLEENYNGAKVAEMKAVFWSDYYHEIEKFEHAVQQAFTDGVEIICRVKVRYHAVYGLNLDVVELDIAHTLGALELERKQTLEHISQVSKGLVKEVDGMYVTPNNSLLIPSVIKRIALLTAAASDGERDFKKELHENKHAYSFHVDTYACTIQGDQAPALIKEQFSKIMNSGIKYDVVALVRGGGSLSDFKPFDTFEVAFCVAHYPIPILTGIGHDRNQSICDLMAREFKTPTKVAAWIVERNFEFENRIISLKRDIYDSVSCILNEVRVQLATAKRIVQLSDPETIINKGFAMLMQQGQIITDLDHLHKEIPLDIHVKQGNIITHIKEIQNQYGEED